jgi:hypothetical protein
VLQIGKLKSLCESFFKLKDIKVRLFVEEEVWIVTVSCTIIVSYTYRKDLELYLSCIKSCMMITAYTGTGMPSTTTSWGGHGLSHGAWNWLGRDHCCGRRELASRLLEVRQLYGANYTSAVISLWRERRELTMLFVVLYISLWKCALDEYCCGVGLQNGSA